MRTGSVRFGRTVLGVGLLGACVLPWRLAAMPAPFGDKAGPPAAPASPFLSKTPLAEAPAEPAKSADPPVFAELAKAEPPAAPAAPQELTEEIGLQETLDRLGYTVNVPASLDGRGVWNWNGYRVSTGDDSVDAEAFRGVGRSAFTLLGQQALLAPQTEFGSADAKGGTALLLPTGAGGPGMWIARAGGPSQESVLSGVVRLSLRDRGKTFGMGTLSSAKDANLDRQPHLLVLPVRVGGEWADEGDNSGHWTGGKETGAYLLCWEDWNDADYQDMVILAENVTPE